MAQLRRQQLSDIAKAYKLDCNIDGTKEELLPVIIGAQKQGIFDRPPADNHRLVRASKTPDEWKEMRDAGIPLPPFSDPHKVVNELPVPLDPDSHKGLQQRCKAAGIDSFGKSREEMRAALAAKGE